MPLPPTYKFCSIHALIGLYTKFGIDPEQRLAVRLIRLNCLNNYYPMLAFHDL